jgi:hypothetical protein
MSDTPEPTYAELMGDDFAAEEELEVGVKLQAHELYTRLQCSFPSPQYITLEEVRDATGFDGRRTADAMAISLYRSRGKAVWGFEFKVSRSDWLHELKQPEKAEAILRYCDYWALVVPDKDLVKPGELPANWGLYVAQKNKLKCVIPCPKLDPIPMDRRMLTALLYAQNQKHVKADEAALRKARDEGYAEGVSRGKDGHFEKSYTELRDRVEKFEKASGVQIQYSWNSEKIGEAVHAIMHGDSEIKRLLCQAEYGVKSADRLRKDLQDHVDILKSVLVFPSQEKEEE